jgi:2,3-bisphosphoglycerate-independent phosphoglycerate mutase
MSRKAILMILDGWGISVDPEVSAISKANTPFVDSLFTDYPHSELDASGVAVGLPEGQMGNSEVGHINIGAGRVVYQMLLKINRTIEDKTFHSNRVLLDTFEKAKAENKKVHLMGLVSDGGVHSHINHLKAITEVAAQVGLKDVYIHAFTDGRDTDPKQGMGFLKELDDHLKKTTGRIATISGRYYGMDRDQRWQQRLKPAYDLLVKGKGQETDDYFSAIEKKYQSGETDEFIKPIVVTENGTRIAKIEDGDTVIAFNFRTDRLREMTEVLTQRDLPEEGMKTLDLDFITMTPYDSSFKNVKVLFKVENLTGTMGEALAEAGKKQLRMAESIKYPHVTYFFNGGVEKASDGEERHMCPTPKVETFDLQPEMAAPCLTQKAIETLEEGKVDFICMNYANPDMVGHTGNFDAVVKACEAVDSAAKEVITKALEKGYETFVIADHGNADNMINPDGSMNTEHSLNPVPFIFVSSSAEGFKVANGKLSDIAPTILRRMEVNIPEEMTGKNLLEG